MFNNYTIKINANIVNMIKMIFVSKFFFILTFLVYLISFIILTYEYYKNISYYGRQLINESSIYGCIDDYLDFEGFDSINGVNKTIVPDIVHLLFLQQTKLEFYQIINIYSIYYNHQPKLIYFHCDNCSFHGKY